MSNAHNISGPEEEDTVLRNSGLCEADQALLSSWFGSTEAPVLFRAVVIGQWALVRKLLNDPKHQVDLGYPDISDYTTLHYAAWDRHVPISILKEMIAISEKNVNNKLTQKVTVKGRTSLHLAAWRGNDDVVIMLANTDRAAASMLDKCSKSALGDACTRNRSSLVLQSIVEADPSQLEVQNKWGRTPPMIFFRISQGWLCERLTGDLDRQSVTVFQEKANILLEAAFQMKHNRKVSSKWELIQSAIESPFCPFEYVDLLLRKNTDMIQQNTEQAHQLLHSTFTSVRFDWYEFYKCDNCFESTKTGTLFFHRDPDRPHWGVRCSDCQKLVSLRHRYAARHHNMFMEVRSVNKSQKACEALLSANPKLASTPNNQGLLPLHSALWEKLDWYSGVSHLVKKYPEANNLLLPGRTAGMYPVMIAAASSGRSCCGDEPPTKKLKTLAASDESDDDRDTSILRLDTIYHLLLHNPAVLGAAIAGKASSEISSG